MKKGQEPTSTDLSKLESRCKEVKEVIGGFAIPWFVEFAGMPRSGKTGTISNIEHFLRRNGFAILAPSEGASQVPIFIKDSDDLVAYNTWTATYAIRQILEGRYFKGPLKYDIVLLDRGLFDATAWFHFLEGKKNILTKDQRKFMTKFMRVKNWRSLINQVFLLLCSPAKSREREFKDKLTSKHGVTTDKDFLEQLYAAYNEVQDCYSDEFEIKIINTNNIAPMNLAYKIVKNIFDTIEKRKA